MLPKAFKSCPKSNKSPDLVTLVQTYCLKGSFTLAFLPRRKRWRFGHSFYVCRHGCIWQPRQANPCTLGRDVLKNRTFSIFQTASPQGFPLNLPCLNLYLWRKTCTSMAKTSDENAEQKRQCKRAFHTKVKTAQEIEPCNYCSWKLWKHFFVTEELIILFKTIQCRQNLNILYNFYVPT